MAGNTPGRPGKNDLVLEIGCGEVFTDKPNWQHLDLRSFPHIEYVQDARDLSNIPDESFTWIIAQDVIEHIGWRDIPATLKEWVRVLRPGGKLEIATPNAWELAQILYEPGNPHGTRLADEPEWEYFNRVAYGHQDYPENTHKSYFTEKWMIGLMNQAGCKRIHRLSHTDHGFRLLGVK